MNNDVSFQSTDSDRRSIPVSSAQPLPTTRGTSTTNSYSVAAISAASSGANTLVAAVAAQTIRVYRIAITLASGTLIFKDGSTALTGAMTLTGLVLEDPSGNPLWVTTPGNAFVATLSGANQLSGAIWYTQS